MQAGMSEITITPPVGVRMSGYADRTAGSTGVLDELYAKTLVLQSGGRTIALVVCDLLWLGRAATAAIRAAVRERTGIAEKDVMVTATHTHCGPDLERLADPEMDQLVARVAGSVAAALAARREAGVGFGAGECTVGVNRRNPRSPRMPHHLYSWPEGTMDTRVAVLSVRAADGSPMGAVVNYACHPVTLGWNELNLSKDYVEYTSAVLKRAWGPRSVPIFLQGCAANINPRWVYDRPQDDPILPPVWPEPLDDRLRETGRLGRALGGEALAAAESIPFCGEAAPLDTRLVDLRLPVRTDRAPAKPRADAPNSQRYPSLQQRLATGPAWLDTQIQVFRLGDAWLVGLPGEICVEYQIELRRRIGAPNVLISELAGDAIGYVTPPELFAQGGYEPGASYVSPEAGAILVKRVLEAVREMGGRTS